MSVLVHTWKPVMTQAEGREGAALEKEGFIKKGRAGHGYLLKG